jgi:hypothetical protein
MLVHCIETLEALENATPLFPTARARNGYEHETGDHHAHPDGPS